MGEVGSIWFGHAMGLLDDAIREHLELKRRRGGDPDETARQEQEALGSTQGAAESAEHEPATGVSDPLRHEEAADKDTAGSSYQQKLATVSDETAELDMRSVLDGEHSAQHASSSGFKENKPADSSSDEGSPGDSLEWELPREQRGRREHGQGEEETADAPVAATEQPVEDVLEETPDFLRETPDQDRLWFEQQPPRDFDFDK
jgi:hypothetical protein